MKITTFIIKYIWLFCGCLLLSCTGGTNKQQSETKQLNNTLSAAINEEIVQEDTNVYEESHLNFFNPIGVLCEGLINILPYMEENQENIYFDKIIIYNDSECKSVFCSCDLDNTGYLPKGKNIIPVYNSIDYGWYCFVCTDSNTDFYEIAINETERKYIKKDKNIIYYTWERFFDSVFTINPTEENPLRESPSNDAEIIDIYANDWNWDEPDDYYQKVEMKDEWLHLKYEKSGIEGWLRWRKGNDVIVDISISW